MSLKLEPSTDHVPMPLVSQRPIDGAFAQVLGRLQPHMVELDRFLHAEISAFEPEIREMANYCIDTSGKRIRPALVFLSGWTNEFPPRVDTLRLAAIVELVHLATLVHDDIMDEADIRRGRKTATRAYGAVAAVLLGDALFSHALFLASQFPTTQVCEAISASTRKVCAGEIVQTLRRHSTNITLADYRRIIDLKTAELFRVSCRLGSELAGFPEKFVTATAQFGSHLGNAYQIYDDLADFFGQENRIGKTLGTDLRSGKMTLPLLLLMNRLPSQERESLAQEVNGSATPQLHLRLNQMISHGIFEAVEAEANAEVAAAEESLAGWETLAPTGQLLGLCEVLRKQLQGLR